MACGETAWASPEAELPPGPTWAIAASLSDCAKLLADIAKAKNNAREITGFLLMGEFLNSWEDLRVEPDAYQITLLCMGSKRLIYKNARFYRGETHFTPNPA